MSIPTQCTVACPSCGAPIRFTMWKSINTDVESAIPDILSGKLFEIECGSCGLKTRVEYPILFNDMIHDMMIFCTDPDGVRDTEKTCHDVFRHRIRVRIVTSQNDLIEKVRLLADGLDDRAIELLKALERPRLQARMGSKTIESIRYLGKDGGYAFDLLYDGGHAVATFPAESYDWVSDMIREYPNDCSTPFVIDQKWAERFLSAHSEPEAAKDV